MQRPQGILSIWGFYVKTLGTSLAAAAVLFALIGCEFKVEEYTPVNPLTNITVMVNNAPLTNDFLFFNLQESDTRTLHAFVTGGENDVVITWEIANGIDKVDLIQKQGTTITMQALEAGDARIKVTAENPAGKVEKFFDILVWEEGSREWIFRIYDSGPKGLTEIYNELVIPFDEVRIIELRAIGKTDGELCFTVENEDPSVFSVYEVQSGCYTISRNVKGNVTITVTAEQEAGQVFVKTLRLINQPPVFFAWNSTDDPVNGTELVSGATGDMHLIADTPYYFRVKNKTMPIVNGALKLEGSYLWPILIVGGGNSAESTDNPSQNNTVAGVHVPGQLDLFRDATYRLTVVYTDEYTPANALLRITINNNTDSAGLSILGEGSVIGHFNNVDALYSGGTYGAGSVPGKLVLSFNPTKIYAGNSGVSSLKTAFIAFQNFNAGATITITGISLEELDD